MPFSRRVNLALTLTTLGVAAACTITIGNPPRQPPPPVHAAKAKPHPTAAHRPPPAMRAPPAHRAPAPAPAKVAHAPRLVEIARMAKAVGAAPHVKAGPTRKSPTVLVSALKRRPPLMRDPKEVIAAAARNKRYRDLEAKAPPALTSQVQALRDQVARQKLSFQVGVTSASNRRLEQINGTRIGRPDAAAVAAARARRAERTQKANLVLRSRFERATPPPQLQASRLARMNAQDVGGPGAATSGAQYGSYRIGTYPSSQFPSPSASAFSWRDRMTPVKDQGLCGSCWAFASTAVLEATEILFNAVTLDLSEQQLVNCVPDPGSPGGCTGGWPSTTWDYLEGSFDATEQAVPYAEANWKKGTDPPRQSCNEGLGQRYKVQDWDYAGTNHTDPTVDEIKAAIVAHGPVAATIHATPLFGGYQGGLFDEHETGDLNHAIVLVGWDDSLGAWHLRNSYGPDDHDKALGINWGEDGYMWIKYGSDQVGSYATWVAPAEVAQPPMPTYSYRYLSVANEAGEPLRVFVEADVPDGNGWSWLPSAPAAGAPALQFTLQPGTTLDVRRPDNNEFLRARSARVWAQSSDGARLWNEYQGKDFALAATAYQSADPQRSTLHFQKGAAAAPTAEQMLANGHSSREAGKYADAEHWFQLTVDNYADDPAVHEARFWLGWTQYQESKFPDSVNTLYSMITSAPQDHPDLPFAFYYLGVAEAGEGYCGYGVRNLEVVAHGEVGAPPDWVSAANTEIATLTNDNGALCANWD